MERERNLQRKVENSHNREWDREKDEIGWNEKDTRQSHNENNGNDGFCDDGRENDTKNPSYGYRKSDRGRGRVYNNNSSSSDNNRLYDDDQENRTKNSSRGYGKRGRVRNNSSNYDQEIRTRNSSRGDIKRGRGRGRGERGGGKRGDAGGYKQYNDQSK